MSVGSVSDTIDPLGTFRPFGVVAIFLFSGISNVTRCVRYLTDRGTCAI